MRIIANLDLETPHPKRAKMKKGRLKKQRHRYFYSTDLFDIKIELCR
jgi:hypothetical protein